MSKGHEFVNWLIIFRDCSSFLPFFCQSVIFLSMREFSSSSLHISRAIFLSLVSIISDRNVDVVRNDQSDAWHCYPDHTIWPEIIKWIFAILLMQIICLHHNGWWNNGRALNCTCQSFWCSNRRTLNNGLITYINDLQRVEFSLTLMMAKHKSDSAYNRLLESCRTAFGVCRSF